LEIEEINDKTNNWNTPIDLFKSFLDPFLLTSLLDFLREDNKERKRAYGKHLVEQVLEESVSGSQRSACRERRGWD
jgi:hypothetical protein